MQMYKYSKARPKARVAPRKGDPDPRNEGRSVRVRVSAKPAGSADALGYVLNTRGLRPGSIAWNQSYDWTELLISSSASDEEVVPPLVETWTRETAALDPNSDRVRVANSF